MKTPSHTKLLQYAERDGQMLFINDVENGIRCNCICPSCEQIVIAKNNSENKKAPHFAHYNSQECKGAIESAMHKLAKEILFEQKAIFVPDFWGQLPTGLKRLTKAKVVNFESVELEKRVGIDNDLIVADAVAGVKSKTLIIEFAKTHFVDRAKLKKIKKTGFSCVEIDLTGLNQDRELIKEVLLQGLGQIKWICNPFGEKLLKKAWEIYNIQETERKAEEQRIEQEKREANEARILKYRAAGYFFLERDGLGRVNCPARRQIKEGFSQTNYGKHPVIQTILKGKKWNGKIYGLDFLGEKHIYVDERKIEVYPSQGISTFIEKKEANFFFKCLKKLQTYRRLITIEPCNSCSLCKERIDETIVCSFNKEQHANGMTFYNYENMTDPKYDF